MSRPKTVTPEQRKQYHKQWREKNKEKWNTYSAKWYSNNKEKRQRSIAEWAYNHSAERKAYNKRWKEENRERIDEQQRVRLLKYKTLVVEAYGGGCSCCGEKGIQFLTVEHIKRNGKEHRREIGGNLYLHLVKNNFPKEDLCILCMNCNWAERNGHPCPHKTEKS